MLQELGVNVHRFLCRDYCKMMMFRNGGTALNVRAVVLEMFLSDWFIDISTYQSSNICYIKSLMYLQRYFQYFCEAVDVQCNHRRLSGNFGRVLVQNQISSEPYYFCQC